MGHSFASLKKADPGGRAILLGSSAVRLLGLRVGILPGLWMSVS